MERQPQKLTVQQSPCWSIPGTWEKRQPSIGESIFLLRQKQWKQKCVGWTGERRFLCSQLIISFCIFVCFWFCWCYLCYTSIMVIKTIYFKTINWNFFSLSQPPQDNYVLFWKVFPCDFSFMVLTCEDSQKAGIINRRTQTWLFCTGTDGKVVGKYSQSIFISLWNIITLRRKFYFRARALVLNLLGNCILVK